jgi:hypothetical protein
LAAAGEFLEGYCVSKRHISSENIFLEIEKIATAAAAWNSQKGHR